MWNVFEESLWKWCGGQTTVPGWWQEVLFSSQCTNQESTDDVPVISLFDISDDVRIILLIILSNKLTDISGIRMVILKT